MDMQSARPARFSSFFSMAQFVTNASLIHQEPFSDDGSEKDYLLQIRVKNARMARMMRRRGFSTGASLAAKAGTSHHMVSAFLNFRLSPLLKTGELSAPFLAICKALDCAPQDIMPPQHFEQPLKKRMAEFEASVEDIEQITGQLSPVNLERQNDISKIAHLIDDILDELPARHASITRAVLFDGATFEEAAKPHGIHRERARQIIGNTTRKIKNKLRFRMRIDDEVVRQILNGDA